jgi:hypothetical protein
MQNNLGVVSGILGKSAIQVGFAVTKFTSIASANVENISAEMIIALMSVFDATGNPV